MSRGRRQQFPASANGGLRRTPDKFRSDRAPKKVSKPGEDTKQFLIEVRDERTGLLFVKDPPGWGENRDWEPLGCVRLVESGEGKLVQALAGLAVGEANAAEHEELRLEIEQD